jgi:hypothetical protein
MGEEDVIILANHAAPEIRQVLASNQRLIYSYFAEV